MLLGDFNTLNVGRLSSIGCFLLDEDGNEVLLPQRYMPEGTKEGDELKVFIYKDSEDRYIATTETPRAKIHELAWLEVKDITAHGTFLDWGLSKDLLVPKKEEIGTPKIGQNYLAYVYRDRLTDRLAASMRLEKYLSDRPENLSFGDPVNIWVWRPHDRGYQVVVDQEYLGMIYTNQQFEKIQIGDELTAYVNQVRDDGKIDVLLQAPGQGSVDAFAERILKTLKSQGGRLPYHDKTDPHIIQEMFSMSKKSFKKTIGSLYKAGKIKIIDNGIELI